MSDRKIKEIVKKIDIETLAFALKGSGKEIRNKFEKNMGKTLMKEITQLITEIGKARASDVEKHRKKAVKEINTLLK